MQWCKASETQTGRNLEKLHTLSIFRTYQPAYTMASDAEGPSIQFNDRGEHSEKVAKTADWWQNFVFVLFFVAWVLLLVLWTMTLAVDNKYSQGITNPMQDVFLSTHIFGKDVQQASHAYITVDGVSQPSHF